jgi:hypothetical protein
MILILNEIIIHCDFQQESPNPGYDNIHFLHKEIISCLVDSNASAEDNILQRYG